MYRPADIPILNDRDVLKILFISDCLCCFQSSVRMSAAAAKSPTTKPSHPAYLDMIKEAIVQIGPNKYELFL